MMDKAVPFLMCVKLRVVDPGCVVVASFLMAMVLSIDANAS